MADFGKVQLVSVWIQALAQPLWNGNQLGRHCFSFSSNHLTILGISAVPCIYCELGTRVIFFYIWMLCFPSTICWRSRASPCLLSTCLQKVNWQRSTLTYFWASNLLIFFARLLYLCVYFEVRFRNGSNVHLLKMSLGVHNYL